MHKKNHLSYTRKYEIISRYIITTESYTNDDFKIEHMTMYLRILECVKITYRLSFLVRSRNGVYIFRF